MNVSPLLVPTLLLAAVLAVSGALKLKEPRATRDAFVSLGLPPWLASSPVPLLLPYAELVLAALLVVTGGLAGFVCALATTALFGAYLAVVARAVRFDDPVSCACFGRLGLGQVNRLTLVRNSLLLALAVLDVVVAATGGSLLARLARLDALEWLWLVMVVVSAAVAGLVAFPGPSSVDPTAATDDDYFRHPIPFGTLTLPDGSLKSLREMSRNGAVLLVFLSYGCAPCMRVIEQLPAFDAANPEVSTGAVFYDGQHERVAEHEIGVPVLLDPRNAVAQMFGSGTPSAVLLGADGLLAGGPVTGEREVLRLLSDVARELVESREAVA